MREHQWKKKESYKDSPYEERYCSVCDQKDIRSIEGGPRKWEVNTPCIEPVPERVEFDDLIAELATHPVTVYLEWCSHGTRTFDGLVICQGRPGKWLVGLSMACGLFPGKSVSVQDKTYETIEQACAAFLRWMRARQYDPYKHPDLRHAERLARPESSVADED